MSEDEVNEQFFRVLQSAEAADNEAVERAAEEFGQRLDQMIDHGIVDVEVFDNECGDTYVTLPSHVLLSLITYLNTYLELARSSTQANEMGCMFAVDGVLLNDDDINSLATKIAVLAKCMIRHEENSGR